MPRLGTNGATHWVKRVMPPIFIAKYFETVP